MSVPKALFAAIRSLAVGVSPAVWAQAAAPPPSSMPGLEYRQPFFPGANYDADVPTPDALLGFEVGSRPATHAQIEAVVKALADTSGRCRLFEYATSHEGRRLYYLVIASEANIARLDQIKADAGRLADPRAIGAADGDSLAASMPAIAWMGYCIHGDEMSGSDAALAVAHHLAASTDDDVKQLLKELVVIIDPSMNPDGRDRCIHTIAENRTAQPSVDDQSVIHAHVWPSGRMNHYLFDLNRDWIYGTQPESRGRIEAAAAWHPHYFMESHEMWSQDSFLFQPPRQPINPNIPPNVHKWLDIFAKDLAAAFDRHGWRYYHGEWNEEWYPGYSGAWGGLRNAVENLYEQASIGTDAVRRLEGRLETYREGVHHQLVSTMANLQTLAANRQAVLRDYLAERRKNVGAQGPYAARTFAVVPSANVGRHNTFLDLMRLQGFELHVAEREFTASGRDRLGREVTDRRFPAGTILIANRQPEAPLIAAMLEFDPRMSDAFLTEERRELLRFNRSRLYDITGWNITMMFDVECYELATALPNGAAKYSAGPAEAAALERPETTVGFVVDGADDRSVALAGRLMERGVHVRVADKAFRFDDKPYPRGSLLIGRVDNRDFAGDLNQVVSQAAGELNVRAFGLVSGLGPGDVPDFGGEHFVLLVPPRIAVLGREPFHQYSYGEIWHLIDHKLGLRASFLDATNLGGIDLRRYNVVILPNGPDFDALKEQIDPLRTWVRSGGTLIAVGSSAAALARENGIGSTRLMSDVVAKLDEHRQAIVREWEGWTGAADPMAVWAHSPPMFPVYPWLIGESADKPTPEELKRRDEWRAIFAPQGALLAARVDDRSWLTGGCGEYLPVIYGESGGAAVLMNAKTNQVPLRLGAIVTATTQASAPPATQPATAPTTQPDIPRQGWTLAPPGHELRLRMSGLLWPEAADRLAHSAYVTRESIGSGQVIMFASSPTFRAAALGQSRVFSNAVVYGPGMGATQPIEP